MVPWQGNRVKENNPSLLSRGALPRPPRAQRAFGATASPLYLYGHPGG